MMASEYLGGMKGTATLKTELSYFTGTEQYYENPMFPDVRYTSGVRHLAQRAGAYWLIDAICSHIPTANRQIGDRFQVWTLEVGDDKSALLECRADSDKPVVVSQSIEHTDFPLKTIAIWAESGVLLLPSEH